MKRPRRSKIPPPGSVPVHTPSPAEVEQKMSRGGGWTALTLATWGVDWPPKRGWRERLRRKWQMEQRLLRENDVELDRRWFASIGDDE
mgnify:CR=1 FL=1